MIYIKTTIKIFRYDFNLLFLLPFLTSELKASNVSCLIAGFCFLSISLIISGISSFVFPSIIALLTSRLQCLFFEKQLGQTSWSNRMSSIGRQKILKQFLQN